MMMGAPDISALRNFIDPSAKTADWDEDTVPEEYDIDHLDYAWVRAATDLVELKRVLAVLRSGKEGLYPDLEQCVEERIISLGGKLKQRPRPPSPVSYVDKLNLEQELGDWVSEIKVAEQNAKSKPKRAKREILDVSSSCTSQSDNERTSPPPTLVLDSDKKAVAQRIKSIDYRAWDQLDPEAAQTTTSTAPVRTQPIAVAKGIPTDVHAPTPVAVRMAEAENIKGNEAMRSGDYSEAAAYYTRAITVILHAELDLPAKFYANRSLAYLKLNANDKAAVDAQAALDLHPDPSLAYKCRLRLGHAHANRGYYREALTAYEQCDEKVGNEHVTKMREVREKWRNVDFPAYTAWAERDVSKTAKSVPITVVGGDSDDEDDE